MFKTGRPNFGTWLLSTICTLTIWNWWRAFKTSEDTRVASQRMLKYITSEDEDGRGEIKQLLQEIVVELRKANRASEGR